MLYDLRTQEWTKLADSVWGDDINWSQDSRHIYMDSPQSDKPLVTRIRLRSRTTEDVVSLEDFRRMAGGFGMWFGLAPDNSPIFFRRLDSSEVYLVNWARN